MLRQMSSVLSIFPSRVGLSEITQDVKSFVAESGIEQGLLTLFCRHIGFAADPGKCGTGRAPRP